MATCNSSQPGQAWSVDPADSPALVTPVQLRNNEHGDCLEPDGAVTEGRWMWTYECGGLDRPAQAFAHTNTDEMVSLANPAMCLTRDGALMVRECASIYGAKDGRQLWKITELSQLQLSGSNCVRGNGNLQRLTLVGCATSVNNIDPAQQWSPEELGTTTSGAAPDAQPRQRQLCRPAERRQRHRLAVQWGGPGDPGSVAGEGRERVRGPHGRQPRPVPRRAEQR
ncbi:MAG: ricin-type beta-trefoil lectin domain protein [Candidatus Microthrix sp.]|nr:ricin-type beta-trefoil lectin domain protein [Candidatus Microthrix sp.]MBK6503928.1 ricin-type beta-trefoil lectin domain protein [Candidatus Microthrix sp.]MBP7406166.1 ricin-type beta-trefoil lectin domain protein [Candidatus Microthrix sp.]NLH65440.1 ricin-type beta-trefoil lectin domain protein [Candidatus Microthrix parvicella]